MSNVTAELLLSEDPIPFPATAGDDGDGAEVCFLGRVRLMEEERALRGIEYSAYSPMAEDSLATIHREALERFGAHKCQVRHRTGFVAAGETSIAIIVATPHSGEAFDLCRHYLHRIKTEVPIWKKPIFA
jgi:molybdopterin synthase catalytic subunit